MPYYGPQEPQGDRRHDNYPQQAPAPAPDAFYAPYQEKQWIDQLIKPIRKNGQVIGLSLFLFFILSAIAVPIIHGFIKLVIGYEIYASHSTLVYYAAMLAGWLVSMIVPMAVIKMWLNIPARVAFNMKAPPVSIAIPAVMAGLGATLIGAYVYVGLSELISRIFGVTPVMPDLPSATTPMEIALYLFLMVVCAAFIEEMLFRGLIMQSLRRYGDGFALVTSSILFGLMHGNLVQAPNAIILGLVIGFFVMRSGSLWTGIIMHFVNNLIVGVTEIASRSMSMYQQEVMSTCIFAGYSLLGAVALVFLLVKKPGFFQLQKSTHPLPERKKYRAFFLAALPILFILAALGLTLLNFE